MSLIPRMGWEGLTPGFDIDTMPISPYDINMPIQSWDYANRPITRWDYNPATRVQELQRQTNQQLQKYSPILNADFFETPTDYHVHVDLPGVNAADLEVDILPDRLVISADRKFVDSLNTVSVSRFERSHGKVTRTIPVPIGADVDNANAKFLNGVLEISFPKTSTGGLLVRKLPIGI